jgi:predicted phosphodiesterase
MIILDAPRERKSMEALIVGDLHGNLPFYEKLRDKTQQKLILVGDLIDSRHFTRYQQQTLLELVLNDIEAGRTECIFGNHEMSYLVPRMRATGYASSFDSQIMPLNWRMWRYMKPYILDKESKILITHAGLSQNILTEAKIMDGFSGTTMDDLEAFLEVSWRTPTYESYVYHIGMARGGSELCGGIFWCDFNLEFQPISGLVQIFGHTPVKQIEEKQGNWNLDCVEYGQSELIMKLTGNKVEIIDYAQV